jgi:DNA invertase Pin-like site-specific DNA recombinase
MKGMQDLYGAYEREVIRERTTAALAVKKARGERTGGIPYGSQVAADGRTLEPNPAEQSTLALIRGLRAAGTSLRGVVIQLNAARVPARGSRWHLSMVARLLCGT